MAAVAFFLFKEYLSVGIGKAKYDLTFKTCLLHKEHQRNVLGTASQQKGVGALVL